MRQIIAARDPVRTEVWDRDRAIRHYEATGEPYKVELVEAIPGADPIRMYWHGPWQDLCRGPHLANTGQVPPDAFKLMSIAGAYWRGDSSPPDAPAHLRRRLPHQGRPRRLPPPARGGGQARPPQARPGDGPLPPAAGGAGLGLLAPERLRRSGARSRPTSAGGSTPTATSRSRPRSSSTARSGCSPATGASSARTCSWSPTRSPSTDDEHADPVGQGRA